MAQGYFEQALRLDPNYALGLAGLSHVEGYTYRNLDADPIHLQRAEQLAQRALSIDPQLAEAHVALGRTYGLRYDYARASEEFSKAVTLDPGNAIAWDMWSWALAYEQPPDALAAEKAAREAIRLDSSLLVANYHLGRALILQRQYSEANAAFERMKKLNPTGLQADLGLAQLYLAQGDSERALSLLKNLPRSSALNSFWAASAYAAHGDKEIALTTIERAYNEGFRDFAAIDASPYFAALRSDPRFQKLIRQYRK